MGGLLRRFADASGSEWEVLLGKESWGTLVLLFMPAGGGEVRKAVLAAETSRDAELELDAMSDDDLRSRLADASPWS